MSDAEADGIFGEVTRNAVITFQNCYPYLTNDGIVGPKTKYELFNNTGG